MGRKELCGALKLGFPKAKPKLKPAPHFRADIKRALILAALLFSRFSFAQEQDSPEQGSLEESVQKEVYKIAAVTYEAQGITKEIALKRNIKIEEGKIFESRETLEAYILDIKQKLINARLFDTLEVEYSLGEEADDEGATPVSIRVETVDSKHMLVLPYPIYDSNEGVELKIKFTDNNFFGTMSEMVASLRFLFEQKEKQEKDYVLGGKLEYDFPFSIGIVEASWNNDLSFDYAFVRKEAEWDFKTGLTFIMPFDIFSLRLDITQGSTRELDYEEFGDDIYFTEHAKFSVPITLMPLKGFGDLVLSPAIEFLYNWDSDGISIKNEDLRSPKLTVSTELSAGRVNWQGNFRKGFLASFTPSLAYNFQLNEFQPGVEAQAKLFFAWKQVALNSRLMIFAQHNSYRRYGEFLRGVPDDQYFSSQTGMGDMHACKSAAAIILNLDVPIRLFSTQFKKNWLKNFNFEVQLSPFMDIALAQNRSTGKTFSPKDGFYTCGIEMLVFPEKWKSVQLRASIGFDMSRILFKNAVDTSWRDKNTSIKEISLGVGVFY